MLNLGGPHRYPDEIKSTRIIGDRQFKTAVDLFKAAAEELTGRVDFRHTYLNFTNLQVELGDGKTGRTCPAALGPGFAAGTTDGPGVFGFQQGDTEVSETFDLNLRERTKKKNEKVTR